MAALSSSVCVLFALFSFVLGAPAANGGAEGEECFAKDTDYPGNDINLDKAETSHIRCTAQQCQDLCGETDGCNVFTWSSSNQRCYLKSAKSRDSYESGAISGPQKCEGITSRAEKEKEKEDYREMFDAVDGFEKDLVAKKWKTVPKDGKLSADELRTLFKLMDESKTEEEAYEQAAIVLPKADIDGDTTTLNFDEFLSIVMPEENPVEDFRAAFDHGDENGDGKLTRNDMKRILRIADSSLTDETMDETLVNFYAVADTNGDNRLSFEEYIKVMLKGEDQNETVFTSFDTNGDCNLDVPEMIEANRKMGGATSRSAVKRTMRGMDQNGDGKINFQEYSAATVVHLIAAIFKFENW